MWQVPSASGWLACWCIVLALNGTLDRASTDLWVDRAGCQEHYSEGEAHEYPHKEH
eukprot:SAG31_NODE_1897_length_6964_cov_2.677349_7_plen_56_part_00